MTNFAAVLLAGGTSTRMGQSKAMLNYRGVPLWRRQLDTLSGLEPEELLISAASGQEFLSGPWKVLRDSSTGQGPLAGLSAALRTVTAKHLLVLAVDMPEVTSEFLRLLLAEVEPNCGVVPELDNFYLGTVAIYPRAILPMCEKLLVGQDRSFQMLVRQGLAEGLIKIRSVTENERHLFLNLNTPSDLLETDH